MKKYKYTKIALLSLLFSTYVSISFVAGHSINDNSLTDNSKQVSSNLNDIVATTDNTSSSYTHTNYFAFPTESLPGNYSSYDLFAQTNYSMITQTSKGILGLTSDKKTIMFTSYSGQVVWVQSLSNNKLLQTFCTKNNMTAANLQVKEWSYLTNTPNRNWATFLITDNTKQAIITLDLDTGLFVPDNTNSDLILNGDSVFLKVSDDNSYTRIFQIGSNALVLLKDNWQESPKLIQYNVNSKTVSVSDFTFSYANSSSKLLASFIYAGGNTYVLMIDKSGSTTSNSKTSFNQYLVSASLNKNTMTLSSEVQLNGKYIIDGNGTILSDTSKFKNAYFYKKNGNDTNLYLLSGSIGNNNIETFKITNGALTKQKNIPLSGYTINSVTYSSSFNKLYIGNSSTTDNVYLSTIDLSVTNPEIKTIQQSIDTKSKKYFLVLF